jgi:hypothetical protein
MISMADDQGDVSSDDEGTDIKSTRTDDSPAQNRRDVADTGATWTDDSPAQNRRDVAVGGQRRHENRMQSRALLGVGTLFVITLLAVIIGPGLGAISEDFARTLAQMIIPAMLAAAATIIGTLFRFPK